MLSAVDETQRLWLRGSASEHGFGRIWVRGDTLGFSFIRSSDGRVLDSVEVAAQLPGSPSCRSSSSSTA